MSNTNTGSIALRADSSLHLLNFTDIRLYVFISIFVALDVAVPWALHQIHPLIGPTFLPMFFFALMAGLLLGWRVGLLVGFLSPLISFSLSGMPVLGILPQVVVHNSILGLSAGLLRGTFRINLVLSLLIAIIIGRLALGLTVLAVSFGEVNPVTSLWQTVQQGWPGIAIQLAALPLIIIGLNYWLAKRTPGSR